MPNDADHNPYGWIEVKAELVADDEDLADRFNDYYGLLEAIGVDEASLAAQERLAARTIAWSYNDFRYGVEGLIDAARHTGYEEGYDSGFADALAGHDDDDDPDEDQPS